MVSRNKEKHRHRSLEGLQRCQDEFPVDIQRQKQLRLSSKMIEFLRETKFGRSPEMSRRISHGYTEAETAPFELENDRIFT